MEMSANQGRKVREGGDESQVRSIDWYSPGECRTMEVNGVTLTIRFVGRKGRRARIAIAVSDYGWAPVERNGS